MFLVWVRPLAPLASLGVYVVVEAFDPSKRATHLIELLVASIALALVYCAALRRFSADRVLRFALPLDTVLIGLLTVATDRPGEVSLAYFWSIALAASLLTARDTLVNTAIACACAVAIPEIGGFDVEPLVLVTIVLVLTLIGVLLALLAGGARRAESALDRERDVDGAVLRIVERMRSTLDPGQMIQRTVDALGEECDAVRALALRVGRDDTWMWQRADAPPYVTAAPSPASLHVMDTGRPIAVGIDGADPAVADYMRANGMTFVVGYPVRWRGDLVALFGIHGDGDWEKLERSRLIVERVVDHFGSALTQADAHEGMQQLTRMREELIANVSHELRTPLTSTIGFLQTLERDDVSFDEARKRDFVRIARREAERLAVLVQDLLELSTMERGRLRIDAEPVDLAALAREAAASVDGDVEVEIAAPLLVHADGGRVLQILRNLFSNGLRHGAPPVVVQGDRSNGVVRVEVTDAGGGVDPTFTSRLFTPFAHWSERSDSSGLGLAIAQRIAHAHGGSLAYRPASDAAPHAFVLELPV